MIRNLLATTAIVTLVATGSAVAQAPAPAPADPMAQTQAPMIIHADGHLASNIIGQRVYNGTGEEAENIGSVTDIIIDDGNNVQAIVIGVGGFLGLGRKDVAIEYDLVEWTERDGDRWLVVATTREALEQLEDFDRTAYEPTSADREVRVVVPATGDQLGVASPAQDTAAAPADGEDLTADDTAEAPAADDDLTEQDTAEVPADDDLTEQDTAAAPAEGEDFTADDTAEAPAADDDMTEQDTAEAPAGTGTTDTMQTGAIDRSALEDRALDQISADDFIGTTVYGAGEENVGSINDVIFNEGGEVEAVIVDVGGFLGMGAKSVAIDLENLNFMSDADGNLHLYTSFTEEQLEAHPEYDEAAFAERRDEFLLRDTTVQ